MNPALTVVKTSDAAATARRRDIRGASLQSQILSKYLQFTVRPFLTVWAQAPSLPWPMGLVDYAGLLVPRSAAPPAVASCSPNARPNGFGPRAAEPIVSFCTCTAVPSCAVDCGLIGG